MSKHIHSSLANCHKNDVLQALFYFTNPNFQLSLTTNTGLSTYRIFYILFSNDIPLHHHFVWFHIGFVMSSNSNSNDPGPVLGGKHSSVPCPGAGPRWWHSSLSKSNISAFRLKDKSKKSLSWSVLWKRSVALIKHGQNLVY